MKDIFTIVEGQEVNVEKLQDGLNIKHIVVEFKGSISDDGEGKKEPKVGSIENIEGIVDYDVEISMIDGEDTSIKEGKNLDKVSYVLEPAITSKDLKLITTNLKKIPTVTRTVLKQNHSDNSIPINITKVYQEIVKLKDLEPKSEVRGSAVDKIEIYKTINEILQNKYKKDKEYYGDLFSTQRNKNKNQAFIKLSESIQKAEIINKDRFKNEELIEMLIKIANNSIMELVEMTAEVVEDKTYTEVEYLRKVEEIAK